MDRMGRKKSLSTVKNMTAALKKGRELKLKRGRSPVASQFHRAFQLSGFKIVYKVTLESRI
jgi:hypothetical protein